MGKNKLEKFADMASYPHVFEYPYSAVDNVPFDMKGNWHQGVFRERSSDRARTGLWTGRIYRRTGPDVSRKELYSS